MSWVIRREEASAVRYVVRCHTCTGPEVACDELRDGQRCPKCGSAPSSYEVGGEQYCWVHRERMAWSYPVSPYFLTTHYSRPADYHSVCPNARLFPGGTESDNFAMVSYCERCQELYERLLSDA